MGVKKQPQEQKQNLDKHLCTYKTGNRRCALIGPHRLCSWHWQTANKPTISQSFFDFMEWRQGNRETYPNTDDHRLLYADDNIVWQGILGKISHKEMWRQIQEKEDQKSSEPPKNTSSELPDEPEEGPVHESDDDDLPF